MYVAFNFFEFIGEDTYTQIDDEFTVRDFDIQNDMIEKIKLKYKIDLKQDDLLVDIFEKIKKANA